MKTDNSNTPPALLSIEQACFALGQCGKDRVYHWAKQGLLIAVRDGRRTFFTAESVYSLPDKLTRIDPTELVGRG